MKDFDRIDRLRREWSDKYVEVNADVPTLRRFAGRLGRVMTINMNGRALVQFTATNDIGWYDIELARLRIVAAPALERQKTEGPAKPKAPPRDVHEAAESNVRLAVAEEAAAELAEEVADGGDGKAKKPLSTADILAAARAAKAAAPASPGEAKAVPAPKKLSTEEILAAARAKKAAKGAASPASEATPKPATGQASSKKAMTTEEILAAARAKKAAKEAASTSEGPSPDPPKADRPPAKKAMTTEEILAAARAKKTSSEPKSEPDASTAKTDRPAKKALTTEEILAMARQKKRPGEASEPGKNPPERRHASPDMGEEES